MAGHHYERLAGTPTRFLSRGAPRSAHSALTLVFEAGALAREGGGIDLPGLRRLVEAQLAGAPRFRQKIRRVPFEGHPVWVDDRDFQLDYHLRHTSLPRPGGLDPLRGMAARIMAGHLGMRRPLWECWVVEGLEGGRFALILKTHHALATGGRQLLDGLLSEAPRDPGDLPDAPLAPPRPAPSAAELVLEEVIRGARLLRRPLELVDRLPADADELRHLALRSAETGARLLGYSFQRDETPLGGRVGPHRRFDLLRLPLSDAHRVRERLGGSLDDVVLASLTGAVAELLGRRYTNPATIDFRVLLTLPPGMPDGDPGEARLILPIWQPDPLARYQAIREQTVARPGPAGARRGRAPLARMAAGAALSRTDAHMAVISAAWPRGPLYLGGARLLEVYGHAPLRERAAVGVSAVAYDGGLCWGLNADYDLLPDLDRFAEGLSRSFRELAERAGSEPARIEVVPGA